MRLLRGRLATFTACRASLTAVCPARQIAAVASMSVLSAVGWPVKYTFNPLSSVKRASCVSGTAVD